MSSDAPTPDGAPISGVHTRRCQNVACRVERYTAVYGHVAMLSCPSCPVSGIPVQT